MRCIAHAIKSALHKYRPVRGIFSQDGSLIWSITSRDNLTRHKLLSMPSHCDACDSLIKQHQADTIKLQNTLHYVADQQSRPPFAEYLDLVSFVAVITISFALSASQGFATSQSLFGVTLAANAADETTRSALERTTHMATLLSWSAATSAFSLMIALALRILQTYDVFVHLSRTGSANGRPSYAKIPGIVCFAGSWTALFSQAASIALIGQSLKTISLGSGWMIQVKLTMFVAAARTVADTHLQASLAFVGVTGAIQCILSCKEQKEVREELKRRGQAAGQE